MIRHGDTESIPQLKRLWKACFADEDAYIDAFFEAMYEDEHVLLSEKNGVLTGASFFLPGKLYLDGAWQDIRYVYALATYQEFRGRGTAGKLLRQAHKTYRAPLIAEPAEEGLVSGFYEPLGFRRSFYLELRQTESRYSLAAAQLGVPGHMGADARERHASKDAPAAIRAAGRTWSAAPADAGSYCRIRRKHFRRHGYVDWPERHVAFALLEHRASCGGGLVLDSDGREDVLLYYREGDRAVITETTLAPETAQEVLAAWLPEPVSSMEVRSAAGQQKTGQPAAASRDAALRRLLTGMIYGAPPVCGYLNLTLD